MAEELQGLSGSVGLVTGAAQGIGEGVARKLHSAGMRLALADVDGDRLEALAAEFGGDVLANRVDVTDGAAVEAFVASAEAKLGPIDRLAHVVGIQRFGSIAEFSEADFDATFNVNVKGAFLIAKAVARRMLPRRRGSIVAIASTAHTDCESARAHDSLRRDRSAWRTARLDRSPVRSCHSKCQRCPSRCAWR